MMLLPYLEQMPLYDQYDQNKCALAFTANSPVGTLMGDP